MLNREAGLQLLRSGAADGVVASISVERRFAAHAMGRDVGTAALLEFHKTLGGLPIISCSPAGDVENADPLLARHVSESVRTGAGGQAITVRTETVETPHGPLVWATETARNSVCHRPPFSQYPPTKDDYRSFAWYADRLAGAYAKPACRDHMSGVIAQERKVLGDHSLIFSSGSCPFFVMGFFDTVHLHYHYFDRLDKHRELMEQAYEVDRLRAKQLLDTDIDLLRILPPGTESVSPDIFETEVLPHARRMAELAHGKGKLLYVHCCGHLQALLDRSCYNALCPDLMETFSSPPTGTVRDIGEARRQLDPRICTKGNLDLGLLRDGTPEAIRAATRDIVNKTRGTRHIVSLTDTVLDGTPIANLKAFFDAAVA